MGRALHAHAYTYTHAYACTHAPTFSLAHARTRARVLARDGTLVTFRTLVFSSFLVNARSRNRRRLLQSVTQRASMSWCAGVGVSKYCFWGYAPRIVLGGRGGGGGGGGGGDGGGGGGGGGGRRKVVETQGSGRAGVQAGSLVFWVYMAEEEVEEEEGGGGRRRRRGRHDLGM